MRVKAYRTQEFCDTQKVLKATEFPSFITL